MAADLRRLAAEGPESVSALAWGDNGPQRLLFTTPGVNAILEFSDHDRYSVTLRELEVSRSAPPPETPDFLANAGAAMIRQLSFLEEPLAICELDEQLGVAQLRSLPPQRDGEELEYWEVTLLAQGKSSATIARYHWTPGMIERERVEYPATFMLAARIAEGMAEALV
jgi:hypothetical protein